VDIFSPQRHAAERVAVRGVLISDHDSLRINVTSLQSLSGTCH
jgi:hypothetical protein